MVESKWDHRHIFKYSGLWCHEIEENFDVYYLRSSLLVQVRMPKSELSSACASHLQAVPSRHITHSSSTYIGIIWQYNNACSVDRVNFIVLKVLMSMGGMPPPTIPC
jgi:hypothetical protein